MANSDLGHYSVRKTDQEAQLWQRACGISEMVDLKTTALWPTVYLVTNTPQAERNRRVVLAPLALAVGLVYLTWRIGWTREGTQQWLFWRLWVAEAMVWIALARFTVEVWRLRVDTRRPAVHSMTVELAIFATEQPLDVIRACLASATDVRGVDSLILVDAGTAESGQRSQLPALAARYGCEYIQGDPPHNTDSHPILDRIQSTSADLIAVVDAGGVALPEFVEELVGDFNDDQVWVAQGRQTMFGSSPGKFRGGVTERDLFSNISQPGKNSHDAALWTGDGSIVRVEAARSLLESPTRTDLPSFELSVRASREGMRVSYHDQRVVMSLSTPQVDRFIRERALWARGQLQILRTSDNPLFAGGLSPSQRVSYIGSLVTYLSGPRRFAFTWVLCATLVTASLPIVANPFVLAGFFGVWIVLQRFATAALGRDFHNPAITNRHRWLLIGAYCTAWLALLVPRSWSRRLANRSVVDPNSADPTHRVRLLLFAVVALSVCGGTRLLAAAGLVELPTLATNAVVLVLAALVYLLATTVGVLRGLSRPSRKLPRFGLDANVKVGGATHELLDLAEGGASIKYFRPPSVGERQLLTLQVPGLDGTTHPATVATEVRSVNRLKSEGEYGYAVGVEFTHMSPSARERITLCCRVVLPAGSPTKDSLNPLRRRSRNRRRPQGIAFSNGQ